MCYTRPGTSSCLLAKYQWILPFASRQKRDTDNFLSVDTRHEELQSSVKSTMISSPFVLCSNWYEKVSKDYRILRWDEIMNHTCFNRSVSRPFVQELRKREKKGEKRRNTGSCLCLITYIGHFAGISKLLFLKSFINFQNKHYNSPLNPPVTFYDRMINIRIHVDSYCTKNIHWSVATHRWAWNSNRFKVNEYCTAQSICV